MMANGSNATRDVRIDMLRGYAMLTIAINHVGALFFELGYRGTQLPTLSTLSFSSAAELFFIMSGYMVGMVYLKRPNLAQKMFERAWKLYRFNIGTFLVAGLICLVLALPALTRETGYGYLFAQPVVGTVRFLLLLQQPYLLGVLQVYVLFMLLTPLVVRCFDRAPWMTVGALLALYAAAQLFPWFNLPGGAPEGDWEWQFNPFAWQLAFFGGALAGKYKIHGPVFGWLTAHKLRAWAAVMLLPLCVLLFFAKQHGLPMPWTGKEALQPVRFATSLLVLAGLMGGLVLLRPFLDSAPFRVLGITGSQTLNCYVASIPATYLAGAIWIHAGRSTEVYFLMVALVTAFVVAVAYVSTRMRRRAAQTPPAISVLAPAGEATI